MEDPEKKVLRIESAIDQFLAYCEDERKLSSRTRRAYDCDLRQFFDSNANRGIETVSAQEIEGSIKDLAGSSYRESSVRRKLAAVKVFFRWAAEQGHVARSPAASVSLGKAPEPRTPTVMSFDEVDALLAAPKVEVDRLDSRKDEDRASRNRYFCAVRDNAILELLFSTGIRIGELVSLDTDDVDPAALSVRVRGRRGRDRSIRVTSPAAMGAVNEYLELRGSRETDSAALFVGRSNTRLTIYSIENIFRKYVGSCQIDRHVTPHVLRHTAAARMVDSGADLLDVKKMLGHASILSTQVYAKLGRDRVETSSKSASRPTKPGLPRPEIGSAID